MHFHHLLIECYASTISKVSNFITQWVIRRKRLFDLDLPMVLQVQVFTSPKVEIFSSYSHEVIERAEKRFTNGSEGNLVGFLETRWYISLKISFVESPLRSKRKIWESIFESSGKSTLYCVKTFKIFGSPIV